TCVAAARLVEFHGCHRARRGARGTVAGASNAGMNVAPSRASVSPVVHALSSEMQHVSRVCSRRRRRRRFRWRRIRARHVGDPGSAGRRTLQSRAARSPWLRRRRHHRVARARSRRDDRGQTDAEARLEDRDRQRQVPQDLQLLSRRQALRGRDRSELHRRQLARRLLRRVRIRGLPGRRSRSRQDALFPGGAGMRARRSSLDRNSGRRKIIGRLSRTGASAEASAQALIAADERVRCRELGRALDRAADCACAPERGVRSRLAGQGGAGGRGCDAAAAGDVDLDLQRPGLAAGRPSHWARRRADRATAVTAEDTTVTISAPPALRRGTHVLSWRVISADGHPVGGSLLFSIGARSPASQPESLADRSVRAALWAVRVILYVALFVGAGGAFFAAWIADGAARRSWIVFVLAAGLVAVALSVGLQGLDALDLPLSGLRHKLAWEAGLATSY